jgi:hypothetical protein
VAGGVIFTTLAGVGVIIAAGLGATAVGGVVGGAVATTKPGW